MQKFTYILLSLLMMSCGSSNFYKDKEILAHYGIMEKIINNPDQFYDYLADTNYVNREDYQIYFYDKASIMQYIKDNFSYGYYIEIDKTYESMLPISQTPYIAHDVVIRAKSTKKILTFSFWNLYSNRWTLRNIYKFYGAQPIDPPQY